MDGIKKRIDTILVSEVELSEKLTKVCQLLHDEIDHYDWVGFYFNNGDKKELKLSAYVGEETDHTIIPHGKGICGQVAVSNETFVVQDVSQEDNYLSCSVATKSEIVVPIFKDGRNVGQIDIDSHQLSPFTEADHEILEYVCSEVSKLLD